MTLRGTGREIERRQKLGVHQDIPLLTTASQARQRSTGGDPFRPRKRGALHGVQPTKPIGAGPALRYLKRVSTGNTELRQIIRDEIRQLGSISCEHFIELALYHPRLGYYLQDRLRIGRQGDFITNVSVGKLFGEILADQIVELWDILERPPEFTIVEAGAERGDLAADLLNRLYQDRPAVPWSYVITEPSEAKQRQQRERLTAISPQPQLIPAGAVRWVKSLNDLPPITGILLANELLDAIPPRVVEFSEDRWQEVRVGIENDSFKFILEPIQDPELATMIDKIPGPVPQPYRTEINLGALDWFCSAAGSLRSGFVLLIDYGYSRTDYYSPLRTEGTLTAYRNQRREKDLFAGIGETDITAHVDFTAIAEAGLKAGCQLLGFTDQHHFMVGAGESRMRSFEGAENYEEREQFLRAYKTLMHPEMMGLAFKYLLMGKDVSAMTVPSGFRYARDPKRALGL